MKFVIAIAIALVAAGIAHLDLWHLRRGRPGRLVYPKYYLVLAVLCTTFFATVEVLSLTFDLGKTSQIAHFWFIGFALVGLVVILGYLFEYYELSQSGLRFQRLARPEKSMAWADVSSVEFSDRYDHYELEDADGASMTVPSTIVGADEFASAVLDKVNPSAIDDETRKVLENVAAGVGVET